MDSNFVNEVFYNYNCSYTNSNDFNEQVSKFANKLSLLHLNINSLAANFDSLESKLADLDYRFRLYRLYSS